MELVESHKFKGFQLQEFWNQLKTDGASLAILIADVLIVAYLVYRLLLLVRGTRAWRVMGGIMIYLALWFFSGQFGLRTLHFILDKALLLGPVALVILFLPELRSAIEGFGKLGFWPVRFGKNENEITLKAIKELVSAVTQLSQTRTGALIVIERQRQLSDRTRTGVMLDAQLNAPLLLSIFFANNPLHDGAVILRGDRILAAGCTLQLSESPMKPHMHLRHRAALGIAEETDAVSIVVSEERGIISIAHDGKLKEGIDASELQEDLESLLLIPSKNKSSRQTEETQNENIAVK